MIPFLMYTIPPALKLAYESGAVELFGAILKDKATGQIVAHVQQTSALSAVLGQLPGTIPFSPLSAINIAQTAFLQRSVNALQESVLLTQSLQYGGMAVSGLGIGVSVVGTALTLAKLDAIQKHLGALDQAVAGVTADRREDALYDIFSVIAADLQQVDTLGTRRDPKAVAEQLHLSLSRSARLLEQRFLRNADITGKTRMEMAVLDQLWTIGSAIRLCQEAGIHALYAASEMETARHMAAVEADRHFALFEAVVPDSLARLVAAGEKDPVVAQSTRHAALERARLLSDALRGGVMGLSGQVSLTESLISQGIDGHEFLQTAQQETAHPLIFLPKDIDRMR